MSQFLSNVRDQRKQDDRVRQFTVDDVLKHPVGHYTVYKITLLESPLDPSLPPVERTVWKRYREIRKLYENLVQLHASLYLPGKLPDFPKAKLFGRFDQSVVGERRIATEKLLQFIAQFPIVCRNPLVQSFFSRSEFPPAASAPVEPAEEEHPDKPSSDAVCTDAADVNVVNNTASSSVSNEENNSVSNRPDSNSAALAENIDPWWATTESESTVAQPSTSTDCSEAETIGKTAQSDILSIDAAAAAEQPESNQVDD